MAEFESIAAWEGRTQPSAPVLLWDYNAVTAATQNLSGVTDLDGLAVTTTDSGSPSTWASTQGTGVHIEGAGAVRGTIETDWAAISTLATAAGYTLGPMDTVVMCAQVTEATGTATVNDSLVACIVRPAADNNDSIARIGRFATGNNAQVTYYNGSTLDNALLGTVSGARSIAKWIWGGGQSATSFIGTAVLDTSAPPQAGTAYQILSTVDRAHSGQGSWAPTTDATADLLWDVREAASETVEVVLERMQIWLIPAAA